MGAASQMTVCGKFQSHERPDRIAQFDIGAARDGMHVTPRQRTDCSGSAALDPRDLDFLRHLPEISRDSVGATPEFRAPPMSESHDHDWTGLASNGTLAPRLDDTAYPLFKVEDAEDRAVTPTGIVVLKDSALECPPLRRSKWSRRLVITRQPASEFYKDEGGKANALDVEVSLIEFDEHGEPARSPDDEFIDIPLRILLFFEDGKRVDDADQDIFRFVGNEYDSVVVRASTRKAAVQFRLEKVSRRKDGKRFRLRIEVDQEQCTANVADLSPIFTNAICVLSKRKHHAPVADTANQTKEPPLKLLKRDLLRMEENWEARMVELMDEMRRMSRQVQLQSELLGKMFLPTATPTPTHAVPSTDSATMEWFLKSGLMDDVFARQPAVPHMPHVALPYFSVTDDSEERDEMQSSPSSSEASTVETGLMPPSTPSLSSSSILTFAEF